MQFKIKVISSGSHGNAVLINRVLIDCGVSFKTLAPYINNIDIICISHVHQDHLSKSTIKRISELRPTIRFAVPSYLKTELQMLNIKNIDVLEIGKLYNYNAFKISLVQLYHNVPNVGYRLYFDDKKVFYATDTNTLDGISAKNYDFYLLEANFSEVTVQEVIYNKQLNNEFAHEIFSIKNHLSYEKAKDFFIKNKGKHSKLMLLHQSKSFKKGGLNDKKNKQVNT